MIERLLQHRPRVLFALAALCLAAVVGALLAQHVGGVRPCPWCVLQRGVFLLIAAVATLGGLIALAAKPQRAQWVRLTAVPIIVLALAGLVAATYQHEVAAESASCAMTAADKILTALDLEMRWPAVFMVTANCSEAAAYRFLGLGYEIWSGLLFALIGAAGLSLALRRPAPSNP